MLEVKISEMGIIVIDTKTGKIRKKIECSRYKGAVSALIIVGGREIQAVCKDGRTRFFDVASGKLKRTI